MQNTLSFFLNWYYFGFSYFSFVSLFSSSVAEYPFATLTSLGATIPPPIQTSREKSSSSAILMSVKILSTIFLSACLIIAAFYVALFVRKWRKKRGEYFKNGVTYIQGRFHQHFRQEKIRRRTAFGEIFARKIRRLLWRTAFGEQRTNLANFSLVFPTENTTQLLVKLNGEFFAERCSPVGLC